MQTHSTNREALREALARAAWSRAASIAFRAPEPGAFAAAAEMLAGLARPEAAELRALLAEPPDSVDRWHHDSIGPAGVCPATEADHFPIPFGGSGGVLGDVAAFYRAFAFDPGRELREPPDHVCAELSFAGFLALDEAYALERGDADGAGICARALATFRREHLDRLLGAIRDRLASRVEGTYYARIAAAVAAGLREPGGAACAAAGVAEGEGAEGCEGCGALAEPALPEEFGP